MTIVASSDVDLISEHTGRGPRTGVSKSVEKRGTEGRKEGGRENKADTSLPTSNSTTPLLAEVLPCVGFWEVPLYNVVIGLSVSVSPSNGIYIPSMDHSSHARPRVLHVGTEVPAAFSGIITLHR